MLGRWLKKDEVVHHINSIRDDNREENLMIFASQKDHMHFHYASQNYNFFQDEEGIWYSSILDEYKEKEHDSNYRNKCLKCGTLITNNSTYCTKCSREKFYRCEHPDRDTLKNLIRTKPFTKIGEMFGVSDNAVRKWCDSYGLPRRTRDIKSYSDEGWDKI